jgi:hypothetical protein
MPKIAPREPGACWRVAELGRHLRIGREGVLRLIRQGKLNAYDLTPPGSQRSRIVIPDESVQAFLNTVRTAPEKRKRRARRPRNVKEFF